MKTLREMTDIEATEIFLAHKNGEPIERYNYEMRKWVIATDIELSLDCSYQIPVSPITVDWSHLATKWIYIAKDEDGSVYAYTSKPILRGNIWNNEVDESCELDHEILASLSPGMIDWRDSLIKRP